MKRLLCMVLLLCVSMPAAAHDVADAVLAQNAALRYWMAFEYLPQHGSTHWEALNDWDEIPIEQARAVLDNGTEALAQMAWATQASRCVWGINREAGPYAVLPHLGEARTLSRLAMIRARVRIHDGDLAGAVDDLLAVMKLGRAFESDRVLISSLVGLSIESMAVDVLADHLSDLDDDTIHRLAQGMSELPPRVTLGELVEGERVIFLDWWEGKLRHAKEEGEDAVDLDVLAAELGLADADPPGEPIDIDQWLVWVAEAQDAYREAARVADLPYHEYLEAIGGLEAGVVETDNRIVALFMPSVAAVRSSHDRALARLAMLDALLAIKRWPMFLEGDAQVLQDPFGEGRFEFITSEDAEPTVNGLRSALVDREGNRLELRADTGVPIWSLRDPPIFEEDR